MKQRRFNAEGRELFEFENINFKKMNLYAKQRWERNHAEIDEALLSVGGNPANGLLNNQYIKNAQNLKKYREILKSYAGGSDVASDLLFQAKKESDLAGTNFSEVCERKAEEIIGRALKTEAPEPTPEDKSPTVLRRSFLDFTKDLIPYAIIAGTTLFVGLVLWRNCQ